MPRLGVNIDHVATLRQARGTVYPDPVEAARVCMRAGAHGITAHLREDRRHIQEADVRALRALPETPLNLEMANAPEILEFALELRPDEVCLVPERRQERTTEGGLDAAGQEASLRLCVDALRTAGIEVSLFIEPTRRQLEAAVRLGAPCVELHTGRYCDHSGSVAEAELARLTEAGRIGADLGLRVNAGHGINLDNLTEILGIPGLDTLNIGHSIVAHAVFVGLDAAVRAMRAAIDQGNAGAR